MPTTNYEVVNGMSYQVSGVAHAHDYWTTVSNPYTPIIPIFFGTQDENDGAGFSRFVVSMATCIGADTVHITDFKILTRDVPALEEGEYDEVTLREPVENFDIVAGASATVVRFLPLSAMKRYIYYTFTATSDGAGQWIWYSHHTYFAQPSGLFIEPKIVVRQVADDFFDAMGESEMRYGNTIDISNNNGYGTLIIWKYQIDYNVPAFDDMGDWTIQLLEADDDGTGNPMEWEIVATYEYTYPTSASRDFEIVLNLNARKKFLTIGYSTTADGRAVYMNAVLINDLKYS